MPNALKAAFLSELKARYGAVQKLDKGQSLFEIGQTRIRIYIRYSKVHERGSAFYGLRAEDLRRLEGHAAFVCFLWPGQESPLLVPFAEYERVFQSIPPADDGQYKVQIYLRQDVIELYIANAGRFNAEGHLGWEKLDLTIDLASGEKIPELGHAQVQTLLGAIGVAKGYDVWVPPNDRNKLDWTLTEQYPFRDVLLLKDQSVVSILEKVDVVWLDKGASTLDALFEVEHSTPIYSGLLRFNDIHLTAPSGYSRFTIVGDVERHDTFVRELNRPTFRVSGLSRVCAFLEYGDVFNWFRRIRGNRN